MSNIDDVRRKKLRDIVLGMDEEELKVLVANIPSNYLWDELRKRDDRMTSMVMNICAVINKEG